jgi:branched-chain amino acid transport system substrate-binding protein
MKRAEVGASQRRLATTLCLGILTLAASATIAHADRNYAPGITDTEIKIGQTMPYSGPVSSYGTVGRAASAYFKMKNAQGGVNGRKINLISLDDAYSPPKTVEQTRRLIEVDQVAFIFQSLGTAANSATRRYLNDRKIPQLFIATSASKFNDPEHFPWTMGAATSYHNEGQIYANYILEHEPDARIAVLYQNDDYGKDYVSGLRDGLGEKAATMIVKEVSYEVTDPTIDSQIVTLQATGADTFYNVTSPKFAAQAIRRVYDIGWKPLHLLNGVSRSIGTVLKPAGLDKSTGIISVLVFKETADPQWKDDPGYKDWLAWMQKFYPEGDLEDWANVLGYSQAQMLVQVLEQCGDDLTRENIMRQAANLHHFKLPMLLPGITVDTSPTNYQPIKEVRMARFDGHTWEIFGHVMIVGNSSR